MAEGLAHRGATVRAEAPAIALGAVVLGAVALRVLCIRVLNIAPFSDYQAYYEMACNLLGGAGLLDPFGNYAYYNPGYPLFLAALFALGGSDPLIGTLANAVLGGLGAWLVYRITCALARSPWLAIATAGAWALYSESIVYAAYLAKENLAIVLLLAIVDRLIALGRAERAAWGAAILIGALSGAALLVSSALLPVPVVGAGYILARPQPRRRHLACAAVVMLACAGVLGLWAVRNAAVFGAPVLATNAGFNLYLGNHPGATPAFAGIETTPIGPRWQALRRTLGEVGADRFLLDQALDFMRAAPGETARLYLAKLALFWSPPLHEGRDGSSTIEALLRLVWLAQYVAIAGLALIAALSRRLPARREILLLCAIALSYALFTAVFFVIFRFRLTIMPVLTILAALGALALSARWRRRG